MAILHEYASNTYARCITIYTKGLIDVGLSQYRCSREKLLQVRNASSYCGLHLNLGSFFKSLIIDLAI
jgi:hypothetical protein